MTELKIKIVKHLCPDIVLTPDQKLISDLQTVLTNSCRIIKVGHEWQSRFGKLCFVFKVKPSRDYLETLQRKPRNYTRHIAKVEDLQRRIFSISKDTNPYRPATPRPSAPTCNNCGGDEWHDDEKELTCKKCLGTRSKIERGLDFRAIKDREVDLNSSNGQTQDLLFSDDYNRQTEVRIAAGEKPVDASGLVAASLRMNKPSRKDMQIKKAKKTIEDTCDYLQFHPSVSRRAIIHFCKFVRSRDTLPQVNGVIAACLFEALPPPPQEFDKKKKRRKVPFNDTRKKRLKMTKFKKEF